MYITNIQLTSFLRRCYEKISTSSRFLIKYSLSYGYFTSANQGGLFSGNVNIFVYRILVRRRQMRFSWYLWGCRSGNVFKQLEDKDECFDMMDGKKLMRKHPLFAYLLFSSRPSIRNISPC